MTTLDQDLTRLAADLGAPVQALIDFAAEDSIGGFNFDAAKRTFPVGSLWGVEGKVLYAVCRWLEPDHVVEIGTHRGASAVHILSALERNGKGKLTTIDINAGTGDMIPERLHHRLIRAHGRGEVEIEKLTEDAQVVFEDASHSADDTEKIVRAALFLKPRVILSHDALHATAGASVREGWERIFGKDYTTIRSEPSDCGLAYKIFPEA